MQNEASRLKILIADVYDTLVSRRPYKEARAISIIKDGYGTHFDPKVIDSFLGCEQQIKDILKRFVDK